MWNQPIIYIFLYILGWICKVESFLIPSQHIYQHQQSRIRIPIILVASSSARGSNQNPYSRVSSASPSTSSLSSLSMTTVGTQVEISTPSQTKCESLGIREWPQQSKKGSWTEYSSDEDISLVRYVLEGTGMLNIITNNNDISQIDTTTKKEIIIKPGTLVEIDGKAELKWTCDDNCQEMIVLTPSFEEGNIFVGVIGGIIILFGLLLSGTIG